MTEKRRFSRVPFDSDSALVADGVRYPTRLLDISLKGALVEKPREFPEQPPSAGRLVIQLVGSDVTIEMDTEIVHVHGDRLGLRVVSIDLDSIAHLRRLMELNLGDPDLVERELSALS